MNEDSNLSKEFLNGTIERLQALIGSKQTNSNTEIMASSEETYKLVEVITEAEAL